MLCVPVRASPSWLKRPRTHSPLSPVRFLVVTHPDVSRYVLWDARSGAVVAASHQSRGQAARSVALPAANTPVTVSRHDGCVRFFDVYVALLHATCCVVHGGRTMYLRGSYSAWVRHPLLCLLCVCCRSMTFSSLPVFIPVPPCGRALAPVPSPVLALLPSVRSRALRERMHRLSCATCRQTAGEDSSDMFLVPNHMVRTPVCLL